MNAILPTNYVFNNQNVLTTNKMQVSFWDKITQGQYYGFIFGLLVLLFIMIAFVTLVKGDTESFMTGLVAMLVVGSTVGIVLKSNGTFDHLDEPNRRPYTTNCEFRLAPKSNLVVKQARDHHPHFENEKTGYPYQLYVRTTPKSDKLIYLGQADGKQFGLDDSTKTSALFADYYYYIQKHHLSDKFANKLSFVKDPKTTDINGMPQYVLKGDGITLKAKPNRKQLYQIYAVNK